MTEPLGMGLTALGLSSTALSLRTTAWSPAGPSTRNILAGTFAPRLFRRFFPRPGFPSSSGTKKYKNNLII
jgi:hypothetical protein